MDLAHLTDEVGRRFAGTAPAELGYRLRQEYERCARKYRDIVASTNPRRSPDGTIVTPPINLGILNHPEAGDVQSTAIVRMTLFSVGMGKNESRSPFGVEVHFFGRKAGENKFLMMEPFGAAGYNFFGRKAPAFIRNPGCHGDMPWGIEGEYYDYGDDYAWDEESYSSVHNRLRPMIEAARQTQGLLIGALQDPRLNPQFCEAASGLREVEYPTSAPVEV